MIKSTPAPTQEFDARGELLSIEALASPPPGRRGGVTMRGEVAQAMRDSLGTAVVETVKAGLHTQGAYRIVPSPEAARGLADKTLRFADPSKGDASVLIKNAKTGEVFEHGALKKAGPTAKAVGPLILWEAMAMATQQHYLVEMNDKLAGIEKGVDEALQRMDDDKLGTLKQVRKIVDDARRNQAEGRDPSAARRNELRQGVLRVDTVWHQLNERVGRQIDGYRSGASTADEVEGAWGMLLFATQVLTEAGAFLASLPFESAAELEATTAEERTRVLGALDEVRALASELHAAHVMWSAETAAFHLSRTRNPAKTAARAIRKDLVVKPPVTPLDSITAWRASQLAIAPRPPASLLLTVNEDDSIELTAEHAGAAPVL